MKRVNMCHTLRALAEYDRTAPCRKRAWECAANEAAQRECQRDELVALNAVREAFFLDTADRNTWGACMCISIQVARLMLDAVLKKARADAAGRDEQGLVPSDERHPLGDTAMTKRMRFQWTDGNVIRR